MRFLAGLSHRASSLLPGADSGDRCSRCLKKLGPVEWLSLWENQLLNTPILITAMHVFLSEVFLSLMQACLVFLDDPKNLEKYRNLQRSRLRTQITSARLRMIHPRSDLRPIVRRWALQDSGRQDVMHCCALQDRQVGGEREWSCLSIGNAPSIWKESAHCEGNLFLSELFHSNLQHNLPSHCLSLKLIHLQSLANEDEGIWCEGLEKTTCPQSLSHRAMTASKRWWACLQWISLTAQLYHNRCIHTARDRKLYWGFDVHALFKACNNWITFRILPIWLCSMH